MLIDRIELADIGNPKLIAQAVLRQMELATNKPTPVEALAEAVGISSIETLSNESFEGALITDLDKMEGIILCRAGVPYQRRRFTIGHELGHYLNPWHVPSGVGFECTTANMLASGSPALTGRPKWEAEANTFAAELLMPTETFGLSLRKVKNLEIDTVVRLADVFDVSKLACARRITEFNTEDCAFLLSKDGIVNQVYRSKGFPYVPLSKGSQLPQRCISRQFAGSSDEQSELEPSEPSYWSDQLKKNRAYFEQVLVQNDGWRLTLLVTEESDDEDEEEHISFARGRR
jgi:Zn-dependent peptidase ImmA (M78 family)